MIWLWLAVGVLAVVAVVVWQWLRPRRVDATVDVELDDDADFGHR